MNQLITIKEKRDKPLTVRLPLSAVDKLKTISDKYHRSQSEIIETLINNFWDEGTASKQNTGNQDNENKQ